MCPRFTYPLALVAHFDGLDLFRSLPFLDSVLDGPKEVLKTNLDVILDFHQHLLEELDQFLDFLLQMAQLSTGILQDG